MDKYGKQVGKNVDRRNAFARAFGALSNCYDHSETSTNKQAIQTGVQETAKQATALMDNTGITDQISNIQQNIPNPNISSDLGSGK